MAPSMSIFTCCLMFNIIISKILPIQSLNLMERLNNNNNNKNSVSLSHRRELLSLSCPSFSFNQNFGGGYNDVGGCNSWRKCETHNNVGNTWDCGKLCQAKRNDEFIYQGSDMGGCTYFSYNSNKECILYYSIYGGEEGPQKIEGNQILCQLWSNQPSKFPTASPTNRPPIPITSALGAGQSINSGEYMESLTKKHRLTLENNGNLVFKSIENGNTLWTSDTANVEGTVQPYKLTMQNDCNLVLSDGNNKHLWHTCTQEYGNNCIFGIYDNFNVDLEFSKISYDATTVIFDSTSTPRWSITGRFYDTTINNPSCGGKVDISNEDIICSSHSTYAQCNNGRVITSLCNSGVNANCGNEKCSGNADIYQGFICEGSTSGSNFNTSPQSNWQCGNSGDMLICPNNQAIIGACGSGKNADCSNKNGCNDNTYFSIKCGGGLNIDYNNCQTLKGGWGSWVDCPINYVAVEACGSGEHGDCNGYHTNLKCCKTN